MFEGTFILFGATGDLSKRRIIPALYTLMHHKKIEQFACIGVALDDVTAEQVLAASKPYIDQHDDQSWSEFCKNFYYQKLDVEQTEDFIALEKKIQEIESNPAYKKNRLFYLALPPYLFVRVTQQLAQASSIKKMSSTQKPWIRVVYEKPFGSDHATAQEINKKIAPHLAESQIFRVDHYLAKEIVGTLALVRFSNRIFEPLWNTQNIDWVEIVLSETSDIANRGYYYDHYGAIKDVIQNHMLQIVALLAMESPKALSGESIRDKKAEVLQKMRCVDGILGQYHGYRTEKNIPATSTTETFAALKLFIDTPRWNNVPFYIKTGKCLAKKETIITIQFKPVACLLSTSCPSEANFLTIRIMPEPGFSITLNVKKPGPQIEAMLVAMDFCYECKFGAVRENVYELVLQEVIHGEQSISVRFDEIEYSWHVIDAIEKLSLPLYEYDKGSQGPPQLKEFAQKNNMHWHY